MSVTAQGALLEREAELASIEAAIERTRNGAGGVLLIEGAPGIGKTTLVGAAADLAADRGLITLAARARELEREFPFGVARQLFEPELHGASGAERAELLAGTAAHGADALGFGDSQSGAADPGFAVLNGIYQVLANLADRGPMMLTIDDAHWADPASLRFIAFAGARLAELPVVLVVAARAGEWEPGPLLGGTASDPAARPLVPAPLSSAATEEIAVERLGELAHGALAAACHASSAGNPFYLHALLEEIRRQRLDVGEGAVNQVASMRPPAVARALVARLGALTPVARSAARALAILGDGAEPEVVAALSGIGADELTAATDELARAAILADARELSFAHPITRNAVYEGIGPARRGELHRRAANLLRARGVATERVAAQLLALPPAGDPETVTTLRQAAAEAARRGSADSAVAYLRRALAEPPAEPDHARLLLELGFAESIADVPAAVGHLRESLERSTDPRESTPIAAALARTLFFADRTAEAATVASSAAKTLEGEKTAELRRRLEALALASASMEPGLRELTDELAARARALPAGERGFGALALAAGALYVEARAGMPAEEATRRARDALEGEGGLLQAEDNGRPASMTAVMVLALSDSDLALPALEQGFAQARDRGDTFAVAGNMIFACQARLVRGELADAIADGEAGLAASDASGIAVALPWGCAFLAAAQLEHGDLDGAERTLARAGREGEAPDTANWHAFLDSRAELLARRGEHRAALDATLELGRRFESVGGCNPAFVPWRSRAALCLARLGERPERAHELAAEEVALAREWGAPRALGAALRIHGVVAGGTKGIASLREAVDILDGTPARLEHARVRIELGAALLGSGEEDEGRELLDAGLGEARTCGAVPLVERAYAELERAGERPRRIVETGIVALTPSERRTAELAASGLTNREIAERLFVTVKTVEFHLAGAYRKLEIGSRAELPEALGGAGRGRAAGLSPRLKGRQRGSHHPI